jgi:hypothetical protein
MAKNSTIELLYKIGAIVSLILAVLNIFWTTGWGWGFGGWWWPTIMAVIIILLALAILCTLNVVPKFFFKIPTDFIPMLIVGLVILIPGSNWGGIPILIAAFWDKFG